MPMSFVSALILAIALLMLDITTHAYAKLGVSQNDLILRRIIKLIERDEYMQVAHTADAFMLSDWHDTMPYKAVGATLVHRFVVQDKMHPLRHIIRSIELEEGGKYGKLAMRAVFEFSAGQCPTTHEIKNFVAAGVSAPTTVASPHLLAEYQDIRPIHHFDNGAQLYYVDCRLEVVNHVELSEVVEWW